MKQRIVVGVLCCLGLLLVFVFQRVDVAAVMGVGSTGITRFLVNRTIRFLVNDAFAIGLIYALFATRKYVVFAIYVQLFGVVAFLIPYFILKVYHPGYNGPYLNFLHRLILNPTLLLLLIPAFYYQKYVVENNIREN
ncbi:MAG TPA: exosortase F system-associated protein [Chryseolinea sp.]|nr:exosortase F system-associated protein [Chryseolinea sp.]